MGKENKEHKTLDWPNRMYIIIAVLVAIVFIFAILKG